MNAGSTSTPAPTTPRTIELPSGPVAYTEAGEGEPIVFVHGLLVDGRLWSGVAERLARSHRTFVVDWPMGSHTHAMRPDADLSPPAMADLVASFIDAVGLERATVVGNDSGGAVSQMLAARHPEKVERLVLTNCDMFEKFPPFPFSLMPPISRLPGGMTALTAPFRIGAARRATYGLLAERPIPPSLVDEWLAPVLTDPLIRRDARKLVAGARKEQTLEAAEKLRGFERPVRAIWGNRDPFFKLSLARRLVAQVPDGELTEVDGAKTFVSLDQPQRVAELIGAAMEPAEVARRAA